MEEVDWIELSDKEFKDYKDNNGEQEEDGIVKIREFCWKDL